MPTIFLELAPTTTIFVPAGMNGRGWVSFFDDSLGIELRERGMLDVKVWRTNAISIRMDSSSFPVR